MSVPWIEKFRPKRVAEVIGNGEAVKQFVEWMKSWESGKPSNKAAFLVGPPGVGKTSLVYAYALEHGYDVVEVNASDRRGAVQIEAIVGEASRQSTLSGSRKRIVLVDEVDGIAGYEAAGGIDALVRAIEKASVPIVMIANDPWESRIAPLRERSLMIKFSKLSRPDIIRALSSIAKKEGIDVSEEVIKRIAENSKGDLRSAINDLQALVGEGNKVDMALLRVLGNRDREKTAFDALAEAFGASTASSGRLVAMNIDIDVNTLFTWIVDNVPLQMKSASALRDAYEFLSQADLHLSRASRMQLWGLMRYGICLMGAAPGLVKRGYGEKGERFSFPSKIRFMQETEEKREIMKTVLKKLASKSHLSTKKAAFHLLPFVRATLSAGDDSMAKFYELDEREVSFLTGGEVKKVEKVQVRTRRRRR